MGLLGSIGLIFIGGGLGSVSRFAVGKVSLKFYAGDFPLGTLLSNTLACLILGLTIFIFQEKLTEKEWLKYLVLIGFCGGFSTFSTFSAETLKLFQDGLFVMGAANILISLALGVGVLMVLAK